MKTALNHIEALKLFGANDKILVALSGGKDSIALAHFLHDLGYEIGIAHVNFHLRGDESDADEAFVHVFAKSLGVPFHLHHCHFNDKGNLQDWARNERYSFFNQVRSSNGYDKVATGHHKDDQVETVLHNLLRGTGIKGVRGMMAERNELIRPLLQTSRSEIDSYLREQNLSFREDSSNASTKYVRNQIRHKLVPMISEIGENSVEKLHTSISHLQSDSIALNESVSKVISQTHTGCKIHLHGYSERAASTILYHAIHPYGFNRQQCSDLVFSGAGAIIESDTYQATKHAEEVILRNSEAIIPETSISGLGTHHHLSQIIKIGKCDFSEKDLPMSKSEVWMNAKNTLFPLSMRAWQEHEKFQPIGSKYQVEVGKYLKDKGMDRLSRLDVSVLVDSNDTIIWIPDVQLSDRVKCTSATKSVITFEIS